MHRVYHNTTWYLNLTLSRLRGGRASLIQVYRVEMRYPSVTAITRVAEDLAPLIRWTLLTFTENWTHWTSYGCTDIEWSKISLHKSNIKLLIGNREN